MNNISSRNKRLEALEWLIGASMCSSRDWKVGQFVSTMLTRNADLKEQIDQLKSDDTQNHRTFFNK